MNDRKGARRAHALMIAVVAFVEGGDRHTACLDEMATATGLSQDDLLVGIYQARMWGNVAVVPLSRLRSWFIVGGLP